MRVSPTFMTAVLLAFQVAPSFSAPVAPILAVGHVSARAHSDDITTVARRELTEEQLNEILSEITSRQVVGSIFRRTGDLELGLQARGLIDDFLNKFKLTSLDFGIH